MKSQGQSQKAASSTLEELKRILGEELTQNFPAEIAAQIQGGKPASQEILPGQSVNLTEKANQERKSPLIPPFYQEKSLSISLEESATEINNKLSIQALRKEIKEEAEGIKQALGGLSQELDNNVAQENLLPTPSNRGLISFLENLLKTLRVFREKIENSQVWLETSGQRQSRRNFFWGQVKKSGSKFLLSSDRTPATQTG